MTISEIDLWRLSDELSVVDAALLTSGHNPGQVQLSGNEIEIAKLCTIELDKDGYHTVNRRGFLGDQFL